VPAPRVKQRDKDVGALSIPNPQNVQAGRKRNQQSEDREVVCVVFWKSSQCVPPRDAFTRENQVNPVSMLACRNQIKVRKNQSAVHARKVVMLSP